MAEPKDVALVTGGGAGIGAATCFLLARRGMAVAVADRDEAAAAAVAASIASAGSTALAVRMDVTEEEAVRAAVETTVEGLGGLTVAVCNAGITDRAPALEMGVAAFDRILRTNLTGCFVTAQAAARAMVAAGRGGRIVTIGSIAGQFGGSGRVAYGASKAGVINMTRVLAVEWARHGILVNCVCPGPTQVARLGHGGGQREAFLSRMPLRRYAAPEEVAAGVAFLCGPDSGFVTGHVLNVDGGFAATGVLYDPAED